MSDAKVERQVLAILDSNGLRWSKQDDGYLMRFSSAMLLLGFTEIGSQTIITLRAPLLREIPLEEQLDTVLGQLNALNRGTHFGKWVLYEDERLIVLEYDLLGDYLQENELMTALTTLARLADQQDDMLQKRLGGRRSFE